MKHKEKSEPRCDVCHILIVDDHPVVRFGLSQVIAKHPDLAVCGEASSVDEALHLLKSTAPDLAIVDLTLDGENGLRLIEHIKAEFPDTKTLVSSIHDEVVFAPRALRAGAMGYIEKGKPIEEIIEAIHRIQEGNLYLSPQVGQRLLQRAASGRPLDETPQELLSNRELEVFEMIGRGMAVHEIARKLQISPKTIESHRTNIKTKLNLRNSAQLTHLAINWVLDQE
jgi:DNA-binding NarL/FixJ family response regulator